MKKIDLTYYYYNWLMDNVINNTRDSISLRTDVINSIKNRNNVRNKTYHIMDITRHAIMQYEFKGKYEEDPL